MSSSSIKTGQPIPACENLPAEELKGWEGADLYKRRVRDSRARLLHERRPITEEDLLKAQKEWNRLRGEQAPLKFCLGRKQSFDLGPLSFEIDYAASPLSPSPQYLLSPQTAKVLKDFYSRGKELRFFLSPELTQAEAGRQIYAYVKNKKTEAEILTQFLLKTSLQAEYFENIAHNPPTSTLATFFDHPSQRAESIQEAVQKYLEKIEAEGKKAEAMYDVLSNRFDQDLNLLRPMLKAAPANYEIRLEMLRKWFLQGHGRFYKSGQARLSAAISGEGANCEAQAKYLALLILHLRNELLLPPEVDIGLQRFPPSRPGKVGHFQAVIFDSRKNAPWKVWELISGDRFLDVSSHIYSPSILYLRYLKKQKPDQYFPLRFDFFILMRRDIRPNDTEIKGAPAIAQGVPVVNHAPSSMPSNSELDQTTPLDPGAPSYEGDSPDYAELSYSPSKAPNHFAEIDRSQTRLPIDKGQEFENQMAHYVWPPENRGLPDTLKVVMESRWGSLNKESIKELAKISSKYKMPELFQLNNSGYGIALSNEIEADFLNHRNLNREQMGEWLLDRIHQSLNLRSSDFHEDLEHLFQTIEGRQLTAKSSPWPLLETLFYELEAAQSFFDDPESLEIIRESNNQYGKILSALSQQLKVFSQNPEAFLLHCQKFSSFNLYQYLKTLIRFSSIFPSQKEDFDVLTFKLGELMRSPHIRVVPFPDSQEEKNLSWNDFQNFDWIELEDHNLNRKEIPDSNSVKFGPKFRSAPKTNSNPFLEIDPSTYIFVLSHILNGLGAPEYFRVENWAWIQPNYIENHMDPLTARGFLSTLQRGWRLQYLIWTDANGKVLKVWKGPMITHDKNGFAHERPIPKKLLDALEKRAQLVE